MAANGNLFIRLVAFAAKGAYLREAQSHAGGSDGERKGLTARLVAIRLISPSFVSVVILRESIRADRLPDDRLNQIDLADRVG